MQEERQTFKLLADPLQSYLVRQGMSYIDAGMNAATLAELQISTIEAMGYNISIMRKEELQNNE